MDNSVSVNKPIIYQMFPRIWGNDCIRPKKGGSLQENGTGKFSDIDQSTLDYLKWLGCSHLWLTGLIRHSTTESTQGCMASNPQIVKGKAGSPFAICDYYDVNPYLADDPDRRMEEFEALVNRIHSSGLKLIIDFIPNHVSRDYGKVGMTPGHPVLGAGDNTCVHWSPDNDFFYYPGQVLSLPVLPEKGCSPYEEYPAKATGNNCYNANPGVNDWYETVKINYGDSHTPTWDKMADIVDFWLDRGVDGFRCDMVELVPEEFFMWLIARTKEKNPRVTFIAEVYKKELYSRYIREIGFDYLYDKSGLYDTLRTIVEKNASDDGMPVELWQSACGITRNWQFLGDMQPYMLNFLENHDEQRFASDFFGKRASDMFAPLYVSLCLNVAPFMIYFGQETGERGMDNEGFSGLDGRTTIFDWWSVSSIRRLRKVISSGAYKSLKISDLVKAGMRREEASTFIRFARAVRFAASDPAVRKGTTYDLCWCNYSSEGFDKHRHFAFLRDFEDHTILVACNFSDSDAEMSIRIPDHAFEWMEMPQTDTFNPQTPVKVSVKAHDAVVINNLTSGGNPCNE